MNARQRAHAWLRERGIPYVFGNPGSTEIPFLLGLEAVARYILGLHEGVVVAMADGYAQASGQVAFVNLHAAPGLGNAIGAIHTARKNRAPLLITVGQQDRRHLFWEPLLSGPLLEMARPVTKAALAVEQGKDLPEALEWAFHLALTPPRGPVVLVVPMDLWEEEAPPPRVKTVYSPGLPQGLEGAVQTLVSARRPALVLGGGTDTPLARRASLQLAEALGAHVFSAPISPRQAFPTFHPLYQGVLPPMASRIRERLASYDVVLVAGAPCFLRYPYTPGPSISQETQVLLLTEDPEEAARAEAHRVYLGDVTLAITYLAEKVASKDVSLPRKATRPVPPRPTRVAKGLPPSYALSRVAEALCSRFIVDEAISLSGVFRGTLWTEGGGYLHATSGGLGYGPAAALGAALAGKPAAAVVGDGSFLFAPQVLYTARAYGLDVVFVVLNNKGYSILKGFAESLYPGQADQVPGLSLEEVDFTTLAQGFGIPGARVATPEALEDTLAALGSGPFLLEIVLDPAPTPAF